MNNQPQLNQNVLFDTYETASFCLEVMNAMKKIVPNLWEGDDVQFEVLGVWSVLRIKGQAN